MRGQLQSVGIQPGLLRNRVDLVRDVLTRVNGAEVRTSQTYGSSVPAHIEFLSGSELFKESGVNAQINVRVTMRYRDDVSAADRVIFNGRRMEVKFVSPDVQRKTRLVLECWSQ